MKNYAKDKIMMKCNKERSLAEMMQPKRKEEFGGKKNPYNY
jgi:hypothetical protein